jgi:hypothetical protein
MMSETNWRMRKEAGDVSGSLMESGGLLWLGPATTPPGSLKMPDDLTYFTSFDRRFINL